MQLSLISIPFALFGILLRAQKQIVSGQLFQGYDIVVWSVILLQATGGILIGYVLKFASVMLKCIAISLSICCCAVYSVWTKESRMTETLITGILVANASVVTFSLGRGNRFNRSAALATVNENKEGGDPKLNLPL